MLLHVYFVLKSPIFVKPESITLRPNYNTGSFGPFSEKLPQSASYELNLLEAYHRMNAWSVEEMVIRCKQHMKMPFRAGLKAPSSLIKWTSVSGTAPIHV